MLIPAKEYTAGDRKEIREHRLAKIDFTIHRFSDRPRPAKDKVIVYPAFSEFGSEIVGVLYCLPALNEKYRDYYKVVLGWRGRAYLYAHLADEFWEIGEEHQWLRDWCRAFHHESKNLRRVEKAASEIGKVISVNELALVTNMPRVEACRCGGPVAQLPGSQRCLRCLGAYHEVGLFDDLLKAKQKAVWLPMPGEEKMAAARRYLKPNPVGIAARARKCYGRNLPPVFYERLIYLLEDLGYSPVWIGEPATTLPCPLPRITDFSRTSDARDLEMTLALVSQLNFTVQFWTASTRLAGLVGTPFLLVESPDQIWGIGQEGIRLSLCSKGPKKLLVSHYKSFLEDQSLGLTLVEKAVRQMESGNYRELIGMVEDQGSIRRMRLANEGKRWIS